MTVLLKAVFPLHNPPELAPAAPQGVGALCVFIYLRQEVKGSQSMYDVGYTQGGAVLWVATFRKGQSDTCTQTYSR